MISVTHFDFEGSDVSSISPVQSLTEAPTEAPTGTVAEATTPLAPLALPWGLRQEADSLSHDQLLANYADTSWPVRLGRWECTDARRPGSRLGPQARHFRATLAVGAHVRTSNATASGPIGALTAMLHDRGVAVEMLKFHQSASEEGAVATYVLGTNGRSNEWGMSVAADPTQSALYALVACANRLW